VQHARVGCWRPIVGVRTLGPASEAARYERIGSKAIMAKKILAVDDEKHIVRLIQVNLERAGYEVVTANDGAQALEMVAADRPDLIVLDWMMPQLNGMETLKRLKANEATADIPVIMLTAKSQDQDVFKGWQSGVDSYLTKPFNPMELLTFVKRIFASLEEEDGDDDRIVI